MTQGQGAERGRRNLFKEARHVDIWRKGVQAEGAAGAKALRQGHVHMFED